MRLSRFSGRDEQMQKLVKLYQDQGGMWPATSHEMAAWVVKQGLWKPLQSEVVSICAEQLARAMREEYVKSELNTLQESNKWFCGMI